MNPVTIIYASSAVTRMTDHQLADILRVSVKNNQRDNITGILVYKEGNFMQVLEGDEDMVGKTHAKILADPRHKGVITLIRKPIKNRVFNTWAMGFKNADKLSIDEKKHCSDFLDRPLTDDKYVKDPSIAIRLLLTFNNSIR